MVLFYTIIFSIFALFNPINIFPMQENSFNQIEKDFRGTQLQVQVLFDNASSLTDAIKTFTNLTLVQEGDAEMKKIANVIYLRELLIETATAAYCEEKESRTINKSIEQTHTACWDRNLFTYLKLEHDFFESLSPFSQEFLKQLDARLAGTEEGISFASFQSFAAMKKSFNEELHTALTQFTNSIQQLQRAYVVYSLYKLRSQISSSSNAIDVANELMKNCPLSVYKESEKLLNDTKSVIEKCQYNPFWTITIYQNIARINKNHLQTAQDILGSIDNNLECIKQNLEDIIEERANYSDLLGLKEIPGEVESFINNVGKYTAISKNFANQKDAADNAIQIFLSIDLFKRYQRAHFFRSTYSLLYRSLSEHLENKALLFDLFFYMKKSPQEVQEIETRVKALDQRYAELKKEALILTEGFTKDEISEEGKQILEEVKRIKAEKKQLLSPSEIQATQLPENIFEIYQFLISEDEQMRMLAKSIITIFALHGKNYFDIQKAYYNLRGTIVTITLMPGALGGIKTIMESLPLIKAVNERLLYLLSTLNLPACYSTFRPFVKLHGATNLPKALLLLNINSKSAITKNIDLANVKIDDYHSTYVPDLLLLPLIKFYDECAQQVDQVKTNHAVQKNNKKNSSSRSSKKKKSRNKKSTSKINTPSTDVALDQTAQADMNSNNITSDNIISDNIIIPASNHELAPASAGTKKKTQKITIQLRNIKSQSFAGKLLSSLFNLDSFLLHETDEYVVLRHAPEAAKQAEKIILYLEPDDQLKNKHINYNDLEISKCDCLQCIKQYPHTRRKNDRYHTIPSLVQKHLEKAYCLTKDQLESGGIHTQFARPLKLKDNEFALILEARIINNVHHLTDYSQVHNLRNIIRYGHHHGAYVFIYNQDGHCKHAMFHETKQSAAINLQ